MPTVSNRDDFAWIEDQSRSYQTFACPLCGAQPNLPCHRNDGRPAKMVHRERWEASR